MVIRPATVSDVSAMLAIYEPIVRETAISFELDPPGLADYEARVSKYSAGWAWVVAELNGEVLGYAYGSSHRERAAYRWSTETSAYVALGARKQGVGTRLYEALLAVLGDQGYCMPTQASHFPTRRAWRFTAQSVSVPSAPSQASGVSSTSGTTSRGFTDAFASCRPKRRWKVRPNLSLSPVAGRRAFSQPAVAG